MTESPSFQELQQRFTALKKEVEQKSRVEQIKNKLFRISNATSTSTTLDELLRSIHGILSPIINTTNFYIALYDRTRDEITFPYVVDTVDESYPPHLEISKTASLTADVIRTGTPIIATKTEILAQRVKNGLKIPPCTPAKIWLGVPLKLKDEILGVMAVQSYHDPFCYDETDMHVLVAVAEQVAMALDRQRAEEHLQRFQHIVSSTQEGIAFLDKNYKYIIVNDSYGKFSGIKKEKFIGLMVSEYIGEEVFRQTIKPHFDKCLQGEVVNYQEWFDYPKIGRRCVDVTYFPYRDNYNRVSGVVSNTRDITEQRQAQELLARSEKKYRELFEANHDAITIFRIDPDGTAAKFLDANEAALTIGGYSKEEFLDLKPSDFEKAASKETIKNRLAEIGSKGHAHFETVISHKSGAKIPAEINVRRIVYEGGPAMMNIARDISKRKKIEETLSASEERFRTLSTLAPVGIYLTSPEGNCRYVNPKWCEMAGLSSGQALGKGWIKGLHPDDRDMVFSAWQRMVASQGHWGLEYRFQTPEGETTWVYGLATPQYDHSGKIVGHIGINTDITERRLAEANILKNAERLRLAHEAAHAGTWEWDLATNENFWSTELWALYGLEFNIRDASYKLWLETVHPDDRLRTEKIIQDAILNKVKFAVEWRVNLSHGDNRCLFSRGQPILDANGRVISYLGIVMDITELKRSEEALKKSEARYALTIGALNDGLWDWDVQSGQAFLSPLYYAILDYRDGEFPSSYAGWRSLVHLEDINGVEEKLQRATKNGESFAIDLRMKTKSGAWKWFCIRGKTVDLDSEGRALRMVGTLSDITERKWAEDEKKLLTSQLQQAQKMEAIGTLAGGIAHDFNNMLGAILGYAEMIRDDFSPGSPGIHSIDQVLKASHRAKELVKQILAFSRQAQDLKIPMQPATIVKEAINLLRSSLPSTITIKQDIDPEAGVILADSGQIHQVVMNLCTNAFHAMETEGGTLTISLNKKTLGQEDLSAQPHMRPGTFVQLSIKDTGVGIMPEIREKIFDPFFTTKEVGKGTGLGLAMVYGIVKSCGGSIACDSRLGEGTEFQITLPTLEGNALPDNESSEPTPHGNEHILLVDDEEILMELGKTMLERLGYRVTTIRSSLEALAIFQKQPDAFDIVITDQTMPVMTGVDLARHILQRRPEMPIILCTGYSSLVTEDKAKAAGIKGFAIKPLTKKVIGELIREILDGKKQ